MKRIEAVICDMDGSLVTYLNRPPYYGTWEALRECLSDGDKKKWNSTTEKYSKKKELYSEWFREQAILLRGVSVEQAKKMLFPIPYSEGVIEFFSKQNGFLKGILSGGVDLVAESIARELNFDFVLSNSLEVEQGHFNGKGRVRIDIFKKEEVFLELLKDSNINSRNVCYVGDSDTDISCIKRAAVGIAYKPKTREVKEAADFVINDFRELNIILGLNTENNKIHNEHK